MTTTSHPLTAVEIECLTQAAYAEDLATRIRASARMVLELPATIDDDDLDDTIAAALTDPSRPQGEYIRAAATVILDCHSVELIDQDVDDLIADILGLDVEER